MKFTNLRPPYCVLRPKMMRNSWTLEGRLKCILVRGLLLKKKKMMMIMNGKKERPKGDGYIVSPYLRQKVENF